MLVNNIRKSTRVIPNPWSQVFNMTLRTINCGMGLLLVLLAVLILEDKKLRNTWIVQVSNILFNPLIKEGLPWITDYHILKNKRFILTNS